MESLADFRLSHNDLMHCDVEGFAIVLYPPASVRRIVQLTPWDRDFLRQHRHFLRQHRQHQGLEQFRAARQHMNLELLPRSLRIYMDPVDHAVVENLPVLEERANSKINFGYLLLALQIVEVILLLFFMKHVFAAAKEGTLILMTFIEAFKKSRRAFLKMILNFLNL